MCDKRKTSPLKKSGTSFRSRGPDVKQLPEWLKGPVRGLAHSRPPLIAVLDSCKRTVYDWDSWACMQLQKSYWNANGGGDTGWLSCVRQWAARRPDDDPTLIPSRDELVRAIVTLTVAETIAHQHGTVFEKLDVKARRHINTTAGRQRVDSMKKVTLMHVVHLALARFDFDVFVNKLSELSNGMRTVKARIDNAFSSMHRAAERDTQPIALRQFVAMLTDTMYSAMNGYLFLSWLDHLQLPISDGFLLENAARAFITGLPKPDTAFLSRSPVSAHDSQFVSWLTALRSPSHDTRWGALARFTGVYSQHPYRASHEDSSGQVAYYVMTVVLYVASGTSRDRLQNIMDVALEHSQRSVGHQKVFIFRDLLDMKIDKGNTST